MTTLSSRRSRHKWLCYSATVSTAAAAAVVVDGVRTKTSESSLRLASAADLPGAVEIADWGSASVVPKISSRACRVMLLLLLLLRLLPRIQRYPILISHPFNGPFSGTIQVSRYQKRLKQQTMSDSGISWAICKSAPRSRQITTPAPHRSVFTGRMPFLPPNQQRRSTEGTNFFSS